MAIGSARRAVLMPDAINAEPYGREGLPLEEARAQILEALQPLGLQETVQLTQALGRTTADALVATAAVPGFRASIMDGYAIAGGAQPELGQQWRLVGGSTAGAPHATALAAGEAVRILTGAVVPEGSERVLPQELVAVEGTQLELVKPCGPNAWIRQPDEEAAPGQELVPAGQRLGVAYLGRLASCGVQELMVTRRPRLGLLISGDELLPPGMERGPGQIWESNSALLTALLQRLGYDVADRRVVVDQAEPLRIALRELAQGCDVVVSTGGVSAGDSDWIRPLVEELGAVRFWKLFLKPGRPFAWGQVAGVPFFGLPGNPVAAAITALQLLWPALQRLEGAEVQVLPRLKVQLEAPLRRGSGRPELARAQLVVAPDGGLWARMAGSQASSRIGSLQGADLLLEIPAELGSLEAGTELWAQLLRLPLF
jgi:molybdopterin molybdotransferase